MGTGYGVREEILIFAICYLISLVLTRFPAICGSTATPNPFPGIRIHAAALFLEFTTLLEEHFNGDCGNGQRQQNDCDNEYFQQKSHDLIGSF